ncbi:MAG TPA: universal stress protein [Pseudonocardia sp.]|jgi:nucleotide-binding universal stress UspA family protein
MNSTARKIVVGVDGSESSRHALRWAARQAGLTGVELHAVQAWDVPSAYGYVPTITVDWEREAGAELARTIKETLAHPGALSVHAEVIRGHATEVLMAEAEGAELLVVGSRGRGEFSGMVLGSVSQFLVTHARCPVVVMRG